MFGYIPALFLHLPWFLWRKKKSFVKLGFFSFIMWAVHTSDGKANILQPPTQICIPLVFLPASGRLFDGRDGDDFFLVGGYFRSSLFSTFLIPLLQRSPAFLAPGTGFVEDNFSMDGGWGHGFGMIRVHYVYCALYFYYYYIVIIYNEVIIQLTIILTGNETHTLTLTATGLQGQLKVNNMRTTNHRHRETMSTNTTTHS